MSRLHELGSFFDLWNPLLILILVVIASSYVHIANNAKVNNNSDQQVSLKQKISFMTGLVLFYIAQGSPLNFLGHHYLFSVHMFQQTIIFLTVPIFIWYAIPAWLLRPFVNISWIRPIFYFATRPLIAIFTFNMLISIYHMPYIMDGLMRIEWLHFWYHSLLMVTAFFMWFPVFGQLPECNGLSDLKKIAYIFGNGILLTPACALIIFANTILYDTYTQNILPFNWLTPLNDQQLGGVIMKIIQEIVYGIALSIVFFGWFRKEREKENEIEMNIEHMNSIKILN